MLLEENSSTEILKFQPKISKDKNKAKPFVKWVGGKRSIINDLIVRMPKYYKDYYEPFIGGGALFFALSPCSAFLSDINLDLLTAYGVVKNWPYELIKSLEKHKKNHTQNYYYKIRQQVIRDNAVEIASRFIYLNKTCYNGLYRVNSHGKFNVPLGRYKNPVILDELNIIACNKLLQKVKIIYQDFSKIFPRKNDFVYIDPPYYSSDRSSFTHYTKIDFKESDQIKLYQKCRSLDDKGVQFMLSNSNNPFIINLYKEFYIEIITASRSINCQSSGRKYTQEVLVRNYK